MLNSGLNTGRAPNFPTPPVGRSILPSMPEDLIANGRNFYTEINFVDYRSGLYGDAVGMTINNFINNDDSTGLAGIIGGAGLGALVGGGIPGAFVGGVVGGVAGRLLSSSQAPINVNTIRLPIPTNINDTMTFNWDTPAATDIIPAGVRAISQAAGSLIGKAMNPLLFVAFNRPNFRSFKFQWSLVPRNKDESEAIRVITQTFKRAASPSGGIPIMDYPYVARVRMFPNDLNGHARFKPMVVRGIDVNLTPLPTPSFFENNIAAPVPGSTSPRVGGAPTMVNLTVDMMEIKLWFREDPEWL
jgi:hypothetical protein